jgi:phosphoribosyl-ATP pyrophosphohydrolase
VDANQVGAGSSAESSILEKLMAVIQERKRTRPPGSYTTRLLDGGVTAIGAKVREEAEEVVAAAAECDAAAHSHLVHEAADVLYHLFVLLALKDATLTEVEAELARRFGISGLEEKAARANG